MSRATPIFKAKFYVCRGTYLARFLSETAPRSYEKVVAGWCFETRGIRADLVGEFVPDNRVYRVDDGHVPDYQPRVPGAELIGFMQDHAYPEAYPVPEGDADKQRALGRPPHLGAREKVLTPA